MSDTATGMAQPNTSANPSNALDFLVRMALNRVWTSTIVQVKKVDNKGEIAAVGYVDVVPLVNQVDGAGKPVPHGVIHKLPYVRIQGGKDAVILDPQVGDLGIAFFAHTDTSSVRNNKKASNPGSNRRHDPADGMYMGGLLNGVPEQYLQFTADGIAVVSPKKITLTAPTVEINASSGYNINSPTTELSKDLKIGGSTTGTGTGKFNNVGVDTHNHPNTTKPVPGT